jgi:hypothetical protein
MTASEKKEDVKLKNRLKQVSLLLLIPFCQQDKGVRTSSEGNRRSADRRFGVCLFLVNTASLSRHVPSFTSCDLSGPVPKLTMALVFV